MEFRAAFILLSLISLTRGSPFDELRSNLEFLPYDTNLGESSYRLKDNVQPTFMNVDLDVYLDESRFNGIADIQIQTTEELEHLVMHQNLASVIKVTVWDSNNVIIGIAPFELDSQYELLKINFYYPIPAGNYKILIHYTGRINENPLDRGFYKGYYFNNNQKVYYATTQFQPYHARKAFPCFDEPQFKCPYVISITRSAALGKSYSNMPIQTTTQVNDNRIRETFYQTPIISAYLIAFHVSDFVETNTTSTVAKPFAIISRPGVNSQHEYAAKVGLEITNKLDEYLNIPYYQMGQGSPMKNDHIALPDFPSGAMENWGMVNYREAYLLYDAPNTNIINKVFIATIIAHEMAHKWFGNLVTCFWWSNLWLNESYASFFEYFAAHMAEPSLELDEQFIVDNVHSALNADASASATPMNWTEVADFSSISAHFSTTSYAKGASVLRMMEHLVGDENFRDSLRLYLSRNAYGIGEPNDMYSAFDDTLGETFITTYGTNPGQIFDTWVQNPGSPVLNVDVNTETGQINITQERFLLSGTPENQLWYIPLTWTHGGSPNFDNITPVRVMTTQSDTITMETGNNWVVFNLQQSGLYRVNYNSHNWALLADALRENRNTFHKMNRAQIVNDVLHFVRAGKIDISLAFDVLDFLKDETDYYVWTSAIGQLDWIRRRLMHIPQAHEEFKKYLLHQMETVITHLGYNEDVTADATSTLLNRLVIMNYACNVLNHTGCVENALDKWKAYKASENNTVSPNLWRHVYCTGLRFGDASDYQFLYEKYNTLENTAGMVEILRALPCTRDPVSLLHYLSQSMDNDKIRIHDRTNAFSYALIGNPENLPTVLHFTYNNYNLMREKYGGQARLDIAINALATYLTNFEDIVAFQTFIYENQVSLGNSFSVGKNVIESSMNNIRWGNSFAPEIYSSVRTRSSAVGLASPLLLVLVSLAAFITIM